MNKSRLLVLFCITNLASLSNSPAAEAKASPPNLNLFLESLKHRATKSCSPPITHASGNPRVEKIVRAFLEQETEPATQNNSRDISRANYDFVFLRQENFGIMPSTYCTSSLSAKRKV
jgi:hypothetical protein